MTKKTILTAGAFFLICLGAFSQQSNSNYIFLDYHGPSTDKPIATIIFYINPLSGKDSLLEFAITYKVNKCQFLSIKNIIEESGVTTKLDTADFDYYDLNIVYNGKRRLYGIRNKNDTKQIFDEILSQLVGYKELSSVTDRFQNYIKRIREISKGKPG